MLLIYTIIIINQDNLEVEMSRVVHFEIPADDPERLIKFLESAFGWKVEKWDGPMEYWLIMTGDENEPGIDGGLGRRATPETGTEITLDVKDLDQTLESVEANGGSVVRPRQAVPGVGWMAYVKDTEGTIFGLMEADQSAA
jgi:predicted enzyme related to lactoylglutathione lyase